MLSALIPLAFASFVGIRAGNQVANFCNRCPLPLTHQFAGHRWRLKCTRCGVFLQQTQHDIILPPDATKPGGENAICMSGQCDKSLGWFEHDVFRHEYRWVCPTHGEYVPLPASSWTDAVPQSKLTEAASLYPFHDNISTKPPDQAPF
ncbi:hypothetical protein O181_052059 [Austropuccinia psidii MF-1]|uniref:Uncharacterized protein n=1 Tax=Austropuccinia psidii MF-1 TaxID=1389203 RepID=A0A9Q3DZX8_9BASI|nr:hypothetical protein [Austropuccinia psidii MF-1]